MFAISSQTTNWIIWSHQLASVFYGVEKNPSGILTDTFAVETATHKKEEIINRTECHSSKHEKKNWTSWKTRSPTHTREIAAVEFENIDRVPSAFSRCVCRCRRAGAATTIEKLSRPRFITQAHTIALDQLAWTGARKRLLHSAQFRVLAWNAVWKTS